MIIGMAGHNKWSQIKRQKEISDAKKSKLFGKLARLISLESKKAEGNLSFSGLQLAIKRAKEVNMPSDNIERAIKKGVSNSENNLESIIYEAYGPGGVGIIIDVLTDNKNKSAQEIKYILSIHGFALAGVGSVVWAFDKKDMEYIPKNTFSVSEEDGQKLENLIEDLEENDDVQKIFVNVEKDL